LSWAVIAAARPYAVGVMTSTPRRHDALPLRTVISDRLRSQKSPAGLRTLCDAFAATAAVAPEQVALRNADGSVEITWRRYAERVRAIAAGLAALGVRPGDTVGLMMTNRPEFHLCDTAVFHLGATPFSIYNTSAPAQLAHLFANADNRVVIAEEQFLARVRATCHDCERPATFVCVDATPEGAVGLDELESSRAPDFDFEAAWRAVEPGDVLTLIYTSGTTGPPKGVEITHANMLAQCRAVDSVLPVRRGARTTSYLPSAHIADRWFAQYNSIISGVQVTCVSDPRQIAAALPAVKPTIWGGVPRVLEKLKAGIEAAIGADPDEDRRAATLAAVDIGIRKVRCEQAGEPVPAQLAAAHAVAEEQVLARLRARIGLDEAEWIIAGAAPLSRDVHEFMLGIGLPITEIYGMSECSCLVTANPPSETRVGSVGRALPGLDVSLAEDGELLVRGPTVMRGYRRRPDLTAETIRADGWLRTGDIASIDDEGYVRIVDRKKELIINAAGKNMSPANIEGELKAASPLIGQAVVIGDRRPYCVALIVLDPDACAAYARSHGLADDSVSAVAADPGACSAVEEAVAQANERLSRVERIKRSALLTEEWVPGGDELTPTMKLKRKPIAEKYGDLIESLYAT
jgi:long-chain acyl-CoA synthetase